MRWQRTVKPPEPEPPQYKTIFAWLPIKTEAISHGEDYWPPTWVWLEKVRMDRGSEGRPWATYYLCPEFENLGKPVEEEIDWPV